MAKKGVTPNRNYHKKHGPECEKCSSKLYPSHHWKKLSIEKRKELRKEGWRRAAAHGLCQACYGKAWFNGDERISSNIKRREDGVADVKYIRTQPDGLIKKLKKHEILFLRAQIGWQPDWMDEYWPEHDEVDQYGELEFAPGTTLAGMFNILDSIIEGRNKSKKTKETV